jgi:endonuclease/exonuclease/phosphatase (EEP) superfamily protein YafD
VPLDQHEVREFSRDQVPTIVSWLTVEGREMVLVGTHPLPPIGEARSALRNDQLRAIAEFLNQTDARRVLVGDLNTTSWSPHFRELLAAADLVDSRRGFGVQPTWFALGGLLRLPIDHVLVSPEIEVMSRRIGPDIGSDHRPVIVDLSL